MTGHDEVLDSIDQALRDWDVSDDAMRWTPEPAADLPRPKVFATGQQAWWRGSAAADWTPLGTVSEFAFGTTPETAQDLQESFQAISASFATATHALTLKFAVMACDLSRLWEVFGGIAMPSVAATRSARWSEYHRRQKRRSRR